MKMTPIFFIFVLLAAFPAHAAPAEVRAAALANGCTPKKTEVYQQTVGTQDVTYRVQCVLPKTVGDNKNATPPDSLLIACSQNICDMQRAIAADKK